MSHEKNDRMYLEHIHESVNDVLLYIEGMTLKDFRSEKMVQDAVFRRLEIIGEAAKRLTEDTRSIEDTVPWRKIAGMRDRLTHDYFRIDLAVVWDTIKYGLPSLVRAVDRLLSQISE